MTIVLIEMAMVMNPVDPLTKSFVRISLSGFYQNKTVSDSWTLVNGELAGMLISTCLDLV